MSKIKYFVFVLSLCVSLIGFSIVVPVSAYADDDGTEHSHGRYDENAAHMNDNDINALEKELSVEYEQQLEALNELKEQTRPNYNSPVQNPEATYFNSVGTPPQEITEHPVANTPRKKVYNKKSRIKPHIPTRSFNNVR